MASNQRRAESIVASINNRIADIRRCKHLSVEEIIACMMLENAVAMVYATLDYAITGNMLEGVVKDSINSKPMDDALNHIGISVEKIVNRIVLTKPMLSEIMMAINTQTTGDNPLHLVNDNGNGSLHLLATTDNDTVYQILEIPSFFNINKQEQ